MTLDESEERGRKQTTETLENLNYGAKHGTTRSITRQLASYTVGCNCMKILALPVRRKL
jgi:hypothetical protein